MRRLMIVAVALWPAVGWAEQPAPQPITITGEEYQQILGALAQRDPVMALLMQKQQAAQAEIAKLKATPEPKKETPKP